MSEDTTKDIQENYSTRPTIETVLERLSAMEQSLNARMDKGFSEIGQRLTALEGRFDDLDVRVDRIESVVNATRSEMLTFRADFKEFRSQFKQPA